MRIRKLTAALLGAGTIFLLLAAAALCDDREYDLGVEAFDQEEWELAVQHFSNAHRASRFDARIAFNLGLSHANAGHEVLAILWLELYLAEVPEDPAAEDVRREINRLTVANEGAALKIIRTAEQSCDQLEIGSEAWQSALSSVAEGYRDIDFRKYLTLIQRAGSVPIYESEMVVIPDDRTAIDLWIELAEHYSANADYTDYLGALKNASLVNRKKPPQPLKPEDIPPQIARVASDLIRLAKSIEWTRRQVFANEHQPVDLPVLNP
jgi:hypothetical protein